LARKLRVWVDHQACVGNAMCETIATRTFRLNDNRQSEVVDPAGDSVEKVLEAAENCPVSAIFVEDAETGLKSGGGLSLRLQRGHRSGATRCANRRPAMARRVAGRLGDGSGPGTRRGNFPQPRRALPDEAETLQTGKGKTGHQGSMQSCGVLMRSGYVRRPWGRGWASG
jgi:ferredoxin